MAFYRSRKASGGGGSLFDLLKNLASSKRKTASNSTSISVTSGKHYLVVCTAITTSSSLTASITNATVAWETAVIPTTASNSRYGLMKMYLVKATSSSITVTFGTASGGRAYIALELD